MSIRLMPWVSMATTETERTMSQAHGESAILAAQYARQEEEVRRLLAAGPELTVFEAAATGQTDRVRSLVAENPALVNMHAADGFFPLALACFFGHADAARALLD